jgi:glycosyltransferase involved in cell wall biosynthesis
MSKKIGFLLQYFYPNQLSSSKLPFELASHLSQKGYSIQVLTGYEKLFKQQKISKKEIINNISIKRVNYYQSSSANVFSRFLSYFSIIFSFLLNINFFKGVDTLVVFSNPPFIPLVTRFIKSIYNVKIIFVCYDLYPEIGVEMGVYKKKSLVFRTLKSIYTSFFKNVDQVVVLSNFMKDNLIALYPFLNNVTVISNWADDKLVSFNTLNNPIKISYFGNIGFAQNFNLLTLFLTRIKDINIQVRFAVHGVFKSKLHKFIEQNKINNVVFNHYLNEFDYLNALADTNYCLISSKVNVDKYSFPSRLNSFFMAKKPIIILCDKTTLLSSFIEENSFGYSIDSKNIKSKDFKSKFLKQIANSKNYNVLSNNVYDYYLKNYQPTYCFDQYELLFK